MVSNIPNKTLSDLLTGSEKVKSFALQMKLNALRLDLKLNKLSLSEATSNLLDFFVKNEKMLESDLKSFSKN